MATQVYIEVFQELLGETLSAHALKWCETIKENADRVLTFLTELLTIEKAASGTLELVGALDGLAICKLIRHLSLIISVVLHAISAQWRERLLPFFWLWRRRAVSNVTCKEGDQKGCLRRALCCGRYR